MNRTAALIVSTAMFVAAVASAAATPGASRAARGSLNTSAVAPKPPSAASRPKSGASDAARRLLQAGSGRDTPLDEAAHLMSDAANKLHEDRDSGFATQELQARVLAALDDAIRDAEAAQPQNSGGRGTSSGSSRQAGQRNSEQDRNSGRPATAQPSNSGQAARTATPGPASSQPGATSRPISDKPELRRGWGFLPRRDREAIIQGTREEFAARYREQIERYYRDLAERAEKGD